MGCDVTFCVKFLNQREGKLMMEIDARVDSYKQPTTGSCAVPIYRFINKRDATSISKLRISIYCDTGSKVNYFTCIFNELVARAFFLCSLEVVSN